MRSAYTAGFLLALTVPALFVAAWDGGYLVREGAYLLSLLVRSEPVERVRFSPYTDERTTGLFEATASIRAFAEQQLGLAGDRNFTRYVRTDKDYIVTVVSAAGRLSFQRYYWEYPLFGRAPYRGFFSVQHAEREAERLRNAGWDVMVRRVHAFSLLGVAGDPLYSFMADYGTYRLASLIFHEKTHSTIWLRDQVQFNEELAVFVEHQGALLYLRSRYGRDSEEYRTALAAREDRERFRAMVADLRRELDQLYRSGIDPAEMLVAKERTIEGFRYSFVKNYDSLFATETFRNFGRLPINNALLDLYTTYTGEIGLLYELFYAVGGDLPATISLLHRVRARPDDPRGYIREVLIPELMPAATGDRDGELDLVPRDDETAVRVQ
ncbi:MAG: aminopeptidase [Spirochaetaceae bacterium]|nr:MAG: aminopeptidase [Spirochaetaceae bacterium]